MGWLDDMKEDIAAAQGARDTVSPVPAQRIDTLVSDPVSGDSGFGPTTPAPFGTAGGPRWAGPSRAPLPRSRPPVWIPDSHVYDPAAATDAQIQASAAVQSVWIQSAGGALQIFEVNAALGEDPQNSDALRVHVAVIAEANLPLGVAYRVTVVCAPEALRPPVA